MHGGARNLKHFFAAARSSPWQGRGPGRRCAALCFVYLRYSVWLTILYNSQGRQGADGQGGMQNLDRIELLQSLPAEEGVALAAECAWRACGPGAQIVGRAGDCRVA